MTTGTLTLTEFLLARLAEDEAEVSANPLLARGPRSTARVLAEVQAERRIVDHFTSSAAWRRG